MANSLKKQGQDYWLLNSDNLENASNRKYILLKGELFYNFLVFDNGVFQPQKDITTCSDFKTTMDLKYNAVEEQFLFIARNKRQLEQEMTAAPIKDTTVITQLKETNDTEMKENQKLMNTLYASRSSFAHGCEMCSDYPDKCYMLVCYVGTETDGTVKFYAPAIAISITYNNASHNFIQYQIGISRLDVPLLQPSRLLPRGFSKTFFKKACWAIRDAKIGSPQLAVVNPNSVMISRIKEIGLGGYKKKDVPDNVKVALINLYSNEPFEDEDIELAMEHEESIDDHFNAKVPLVTITNDKLFVIPIDKVENPSVNEDEGKKEGGRKKRMKRKTKRKRKLRRKKKSHRRRNRRNRRTRRKKLCITKKH